jgi:hypothetical protein
LVPEDRQAAAAGRQFQPVGAAALEALSGLGRAQSVAADLQLAEAILGTEAVPLGLIKGLKQDLGLEATP